MNQTNGNIINQCGIKDLQSSSTEQVKHQILHVLDIAKQCHPRAKIHITSILSRSDIHNYRTVNEYIREPTKRKQCYYIDTVSEFTINMYRDDKHPNMKGVGKIVRNIKEAIYPNYRNQETYRFPMSKPSYASNMTNSNQMYRNGNRNRYEYRPTYSEVVNKGMSSVIQKRNIVNNNEYGYHQSTNTALVNSPNGNIPNYWYTPQPPPQNMGPMPQSQPQPQNMGCMPQSQHRPQT